eukprot:5832947-Prymnesium_polylepis.1
MLAEDAPEQHRVDGKKPFANMLLIPRGADRVTMELFLASMAVGVAECVDEPNGHESEVDQGIDTAGRLLQRCPRAAPKPGVVHVKHKLNDCLRTSSQFAVG